MRLTNVRYLHHCTYMYAIIYNQCSQTVYTHLIILDIPRVFVHSKTGKNLLPIYMYFPKWDTNRGLFYFRFQFHDLWLFRSCLAVLQVSCKRYIFTILFYQNENHYWMELRQFFEPCIRINWVQLTFIWKRLECKLVIVFAHVGGSSNVGLNFFLYDHVNKYL